MDQKTRPGSLILVSTPVCQARFLESRMAEVQSLSAERIADAFRVPRELLIEPGHVMSEKTYQRLVEAQQKQK